RASGLQGRCFPRYGSERQEVRDGSDDEDPDETDAEANQSDLEVRAGLLFVRHDPRVTGTGSSACRVANIMPVPLLCEFQRLAFIVPISGGSDLPPGAPASVPPNLR